MRFRHSLYLGILRHPRYFQAIICNLKVHHIRFMRCPRSTQFSTNKSWSRCRWDEFTVPGSATMGVH